MNKTVCTLTYGKKGIKIKNIGDYYQGLVDNKVTVGVHKGAGKNVVQKAIWNEFGTTPLTIIKPLRRRKPDGTYLIFKAGTVLHIPARPFVRLYLYADKKKKITNSFSEIIRQQTKKLANAKGKALAKEAYNDIGFKARAEMKDIILSNSRLKPNSPATVEIKGFDYPLVNSGQLVQSIDYRVKKRGA